MSSCSVSGFGGIVAFVIVVVVGVIDDDVVSAFVVVVAMVVVKGIVAVRPPSDATSTADRNALSRSIERERERENRCERTAT